MSGEDNKKAWGGIAIGGGSGGAGHDPKNCGDVVADGKRYSPEMVKALLTERNELAATVEELRSAIDGIRTSSKSSGFGVQSPQSARDSRIAWMQLNEVLAATPQQHLRDARAEAGRAGVLHMHHTLSACYSGYGSGSDSAEAAIIAEQYAASVKAGE